jgi:dCMP deaminase
MDKDWTDRGLGLAFHVATWSKDPSTQVGAAIFDPDHRVLGVGYNGFPRGVADDGRLDVKEEKYPRIVHAEANAIINSQGDRHTLYCTHYPCSGCAALIIQAGIKVVIAPASQLAGWGDSQSIAHDMFVEAGVYSMTVEVP